MTSAVVELRRCPSCPVHSAFVAGVELQPYSAVPVSSDGWTDQPVRPLAARCPACGAVASLDDWELLRSGSGDELLRHHPPEADSGADAHLAAARAAEDQSRPEGPASTTPAAWMLRVRAWQLASAELEPAPSPPLLPRALTPDHADNLARIVAGPPAPTPWPAAVVATLRADAARQLGAFDEAQRLLDDARRERLLEQVDVAPAVLDALEALVRARDAAPRTLPVDVPDPAPDPVAWQPSRRAVRRLPEPAAVTRPLGRDRRSLAPPTPEQARRWKRLSIANVVAVVVVLAATLGILIWLST